MAFKNHTFPNFVIRIYYFQELCCHGFTKVESNYFFRSWMYRHILILHDVIEE